jgi:hypothetical protein
LSDSGGCLKAAAPGRMDQAMPGHPLPSFRGSVCLWLGILDIHVHALKNVPLN